MERLTLVIEIKSISMEDFSSISRAKPVVELILIPKESPYLFSLAFCNVNLLHFEILWGKKYYNISIAYQPHP